MLPFWVEKSTGLRLRRLPLASRNRIHNTLLNSSLHIHLRLLIQLHLTHLSHPYTRHPPIQLRYHSLRLLTRHLPLQWFPRALTDMRLCQVRLDGQQ